MAQGQKKKIKPPAAKHSTRVQGGNKVIKPKKASLIKQNQIKKKHTSGMAALTEKTLAGKAGHLELLRGGKKDRKEVAGSLTKKMT